MRERRVVFKIGVVYETTADELERIPRIIEEVVRAQPRARFDRAHFFEYGDFSLVFEIVYYVYGADGDSWNRGRGQRDRAGGQSIFPRRCWS